MAVMVVIEVPQGTQEQYDNVFKNLGVAGNLPSDRGWQFHVASPMDGGWRVIDVWESAKAFQDYVASDLGAALQKAGVPPFTPQVQPLHAMLKP